MKGFAMMKIGQTGWVEKDKPVCGPCDAICKPLALAPCTSDVHTVWAGAIGDRHEMILGHEAVGEVVEVGALVKDFKPGDRVLIAAITPDGTLWRPRAALPCTPAACSPAGSSPTSRTACSGNTFM